MNLHTFIRSLTTHNELAGSLYALYAQLQNMEMKNGWQDKTKQQQRPENARMREQEHDKKDGKNSTLHTQTKKKMCNNTIWLPLDTDDLLYIISKPKTFNCSLPDREAMYVCE